MGTMREYIPEQPVVLHDILQNRKNHTKVFADRMETLRPDRLYLIASGSSLNAVRASADFMAQVLGIEVTAHASSYLPCIRGERPFIVFVSQGGNSLNTLVAVESLAAYPSIALTGNDQCHLNGLCGEHLLIGCGPENVGPKTKGYTATVLTLYLMALESALRQGCIQESEYDAYITELTAVIAAMPGNIKETEAWYARNEMDMIPLTKCSVVGKNLASWVSVEGALKLLETLLIPAAAYEFEEFLHGPASAIDKAMGGIYLLPDQDDPDYDRIIALAQYHRSICPMVYIVGETPSPDTKDCALRWGAWYTGTFAWILPCQMVAACLPDRMGITGTGSERFQRLSKILNIKYKGGA